MTKVLGAIIPNELFTLKGIQFYLLLTTPQETWVFGYRVDEEQLLPQRTDLFV